MATKTSFNSFSYQTVWEGPVTNSGAGDFLDGDLTSDSFSTIRLNPDGFSYSSNVMDVSVAPTISGGTKAQLDFRGSIGPKGTEGYLASFGETADSLESSLMDTATGVHSVYGGVIDTNGVNFILAAIQDNNVETVVRPISFGLQGVARIEGVTIAPEPAPWQTLAVGFGLMVIAFSRKR